MTRNNTLQIEPAFEQFMQRRFDRASDDLNDSGDASSGCHAEGDVLRFGFAFLRDVRKDVGTGNRVGLQNADRFGDGIDDRQAIENRFAASFGTHRPRSHRKVLSNGNFPTRVLGSHASVQGVVGHDLDDWPGAQRRDRRLDGDLRESCHADLGQRDAGLKTALHATAEIDGSPTQMVRVDVNSQTFRSVTNGLTEVQCAMV